MRSRAEEANAAVTSWYGTRMATSVASRLLSVVLLVAGVACGGATEVSKDAGAPGGGGSSGSGSSGGRPCTEIGCNNGVHIEFSFREPGSYVFDLTLDGAKVTCNAVLPLPRNSGDGCSRNDVVLTRVGSELPLSQQSIGGITLTSSPSKITLRAERDGQLLGEATILPAYVTTPGPNGPGCPPKECKSATARFP